MVTVRSIVGHVLSQFLGRWFAPSAFYNDGPLSIDADSSNFSKNSSSSSELPNVTSSMYRGDVFNDCGKSVWAQPIYNFSEVRGALTDVMRHAPSHSMLGMALAKLKSKYGVSVCVVDLIAEVLDQCRSNDIEMIGIEDHLYPANLKQISRPPLVLFCRGNIGALSDEIIAIIGSRKASYFGLHAARSIAHSLTLDGKRIVTGGAIGCDTAASIGSLQVHDRGPILVFAGGLLELYPRCNHKIFETTLQNQGLLVSEKLPRHQCRRFDFPIRNRIISGMSQQVIVAQASEKSGALVTAHEALAEGRDVWVVPHPAEDVRALGGNRLIEDGATPMNHCGESWF